MATVRELQVQVDNMAKDLAVWRRDDTVRPVRDPLSGGVIGQTQFAVVREIGTGTEKYVMVQRLRQVAAVPGWVYASDTYEQVATYGNMVSAEYGPFICTVPGAWDPAEKCLVIPLVRSNLSWVACPWSAPEMVDINDLPLVPRTDAFPPIGGRGEVPAPTPPGDNDGLVVVSAGPFFNGTFSESFDALVSSDGSTVTMTLEKEGGGDLTMNFTDGPSTLDCTPAATISLTPGSDSSPQMNYVYILQSTLGLAKSTTGWPEDVEHIRIAPFFVPSASLVNSGSPENDFVYINANVNDEAAGPDGQGHLTHITEKLRHLGATWHHGTEGIATQDGNDLWVSVSAGGVSQIHHHEFLALDSDTAGAGHKILVVNDPDAAFTRVNSLNEITKHSDGDVIGVAKYVKYVLWGVANKTGAVSMMMLNLPSEHYNTAADAKRDVEGYADFSIPREYNLDTNTGFLIAAFICQHTASGMILQETIDLRGHTPFTLTGGGGAPGGGDVTAAAILTDNVIVTGDGGAKGVQTRGVIIDAANNLSGIGNITLSGTVDGVVVDTHAARHMPAGADILQVSDSQRFLGRIGIGAGNVQEITGAQMETALGYGLVTNPLSQFAATTSAQLAGVILDETGSGALVFATSPALVTPSIVTSVSLTDNVKAILGTGSDVEIYYDGTDLIINPDAVGAGIVDITGDARCDHLAVGSGLAPSTARLGYFLESGSTTLIALEGTLTYSGPSSPARGLFFTADYRGSNANPSAFGADVAGRLTKTIGAGNTGLAVGLFGTGHVNKQQTSATATINCFGVYGRVLKNLGFPAHTGGNFNMISVYGAAPPTPGGSPTSVNLYAGWFDGAVRITGDLDHDGSKIGLFGTDPVVQVAAYTPTNVTPTRSYDADATSVAELADVVGTLIADIQTYGLVP